MIVLVVGLEQV